MSMTQFCHKVKTADRPPCYLITGLHQTSTVCRYKDLPVQLLCLASTKKNIIMWIDTCNCNKRRKKCWQAINKSYIVIRPVGKGSCRGLFSHQRVTKFRGCDPQKEGQLQKLKIAKCSWPCRVKIQPYFWARPTHSLPFWNFYWKFCKIFSTVTIQDRLSVNIFSWVHVQLLIISTKYFIP